MNELLEKLVKAETETEFYPLVGEIRKAAENDPQGWAPKIEDAYSEAVAKETYARAVYETSILGFDGAEDVNAKAAAWDAYCQLKGFQAIAEALYEERSNVAYIMGIIEHEGIATWEKFKGERAKQRELLAAQALDEGFPF